MDKYKIAFTALHDVNDKRSWSGTLYSMSKSLQKHFDGDIYYIEPANDLRSKIFLKILLPFTFLLRKGFKRSYLCPYNKLICKNFSRYIEKRLKGKHFDLIFAPIGASELAFLNTEIPIIYLSDTTVNLLYGSKNRYANNPLEISFKEGNFIEKSAIEKSDMVIYSSKWAANSAIEDYGADESKIHVVPFGANIEEVPSKELVIMKKRSDSCNLLFLGTDWATKGGKIAFETLLELEKLGINTKLTVCGCVPPKEFVHKNMVVIPFLNKSDEKQSHELYDLLLRSDFLILPTRSDSTPIVFCEANAFGLPVITTDTGGVSGVIEEGKNGFMLPLDADATSYAKLIKKIFLDDDKYQELVKSSRKTFDEKLNWDSWGIKVSELINRTIKTL